MRCLLHKGGETPGCLPHGRNSRARILPWGFPPHHPGTATLSGTSEKARAGAQGVGMARYQSTLGDGGHRDAVPLATATLEHQSISQGLQDRQRIHFQGQSAPGGRSSSEDARIPGRHSSGGGILRRHSPSTLRIVMALESHHILLSGNNTWLRHRLLSYKTGVNRPYALHRGKIRGVSS